MYLVVSNLIWKRSFSKFSENILIFFDANDLLKNCRWCPIIENPISGKILGGQWNFMAHVSNRSRGNWRISLIFDMHLILITWLVLIRFSRLRPQFCWELEGCLIDWHALELMKGHYFHCTIPPFQKTIIRNEVRELKMISR